MADPSPTSGDGARPVVARTGTGRGRSFTSADGAEATCDRLYWMVWSGIHGIHISVGALSMFVGMGYDIHRLEPGHPLVLGGVTIPDADRGAVAHSDGDVVIHALCDALLGAAGLEDIGHHFPDTDDRYRDINSMTLLGEVVSLLASSGFVPVQSDCTIVLERPKVGPYRAEMRERLGKAMGIPVNRVSVKATTNESLGPIGAGEGVAAFAVATIAEQ